MKSFAIICEGVTDFQVISNILMGFCGEEPAVVQFEPPQMAEPTPPPGGWTLVFHALRRGRVREALQFHDYVVIHIDTDVCEEKGFDVPRKHKGSERSVQELRDAVIARLRQVIGLESFDEIAPRLIFAIAVDSIECWLLPICFETEKKKAAKTTGCLDAVNGALAARGKKKAEKSLSPHGIGAHVRYDEVSTEYRKRKRLLALAPKQPSLSLFVEALNAQVSP